MSLSPHVSADPAGLTSPALLYSPAFAVRFFNRRHSGDWAQRLSAQCLQALLSTGEAVLDVQSIDVSGTHGYAGALSTRAVALGRSPSSLRRALSGFARWVATPLQSLRLRRHVGHGLRQAAAMVIDGEALFTTAGGLNAAVLTCLAHARSASPALPLALHQVQLSPSNNSTIDAQLLSALARTRLVDVSAVDATSRDEWNRRFTPGCGVSARLEPSPLSLACQVYPFRRECANTAVLRVAVVVTAMPISGQTAREFFNALIHELLRTGAQLVLIPGGSATDQALADTLARQLDAALTGGRLAMVLSTPREVCLALASSDLVMAQTPPALTVAQSYGRCVVKLPGEAPVDDWAFLQLPTTVGGALQRIRTMPSSSVLSLWSSSHTAQAGIARLKAALNSACATTAVEPAIRAAVCAPTQLYINGRFLRRRTTGVERVAEEVVRGLDRLLGRMPAGLRPSIILLVPDGARPLPLHHVRVVSLPGKAGIAWEQGSLRWATRRGFLINLCNAGPLFNRQQLVLIHDAATERWPLSYKKSFRLWYRLMIPVLYRWSAAVATVSRFSRDELSAVHGFRPGVQVVTEGADHMERLTPDLGIFARQSFTERPFVLAVGSMALHKNFSVVVRAMQQLATANDLPFDLVIAGGFDGHVFGAQVSEWPAWIKHVGYVSDAELNALYRQALCLVFPSIYEGFGLPPLEAMRVGCPVVSSMAASMPEVLGHCALYFSPWDASSLAHCLTAMHDQPVLRQTLVERGHAMAATHAWDDTAAHLLGQALGQSVDPAWRQVTPDTDVVVGQPLKPSRVASFDIFETLLMRPFLQPHDLHEAVFHRDDFPCLASLTASQWKALRIQAEADARRANGAREISVHQIYARLQATLQWSDATVAAAQQAEMAHELAVMTPIAAQAAQLQLARQHTNTRICFLSDMYLPRKHIAGMLSQHGLLQASDLLLVSSELGYSKAEGSLFTHLMSRVELQPKQIHHVGDNRHSDWRMPRRLGIHAQHTQVTALNRYERRLTEDTREPAFLRSAIAGASRAARLADEPASAAHQTIRDVSASVAAPFLFGFVLWTLRAAQQAGIQHLGFLARDGQILQRIAQVIQAHGRGRLDLQSSYIYGSRQALFLPALDLEREESIDVLARMFVGRTLTDIAVSLEIDLPSLITCARRVVPSVEEAVDVTVSASQAHLLAVALRQSPVATVVQANASKQRGALVDYLAQHIPAGQRFGIVDVGWRGNLQTFLARALRYAGNPNSPHTGFTPLVGYYVGLAQSPPAEAGAAHAYLSSIQPSQPELIELMCAADHGTTLRYEHNPLGQAVARLDPRGNPQAVQWGLQQQQDSILRFATTMCAALPPAVLFADDTLATLRRHGLRSLELLRLSPSHLEASTYGGFNHSEDPRHRQFVPLAPARSPLALITGRLAPKYFVQPHSYWMEATYMRTLGTGALGLLNQHLLARRARRVLRATDLHASSNPSLS